MNMTESGLDQLAREGYKVLNLITFFTVGETENRFVCEQREDAM